MNKFDITDSGIYKIINKTNGKYYPGSSKHLLKGSNNRKYKHFWMLKNNKHHCQYLQNAYNLDIKNGLLDNYEFIIVKNNIPEDQLIIEEQKLLDYARDFEPEMCYTNNFDAFIPEMTEERKQKISKSLKGKMNGEKNPMFGKKHTEESKRKSSESQKKLYENGYISPCKGVPKSEETKEKLSIAHKGIRLGYKHSEETKKLMSKNNARINLGKNPSLETRLKQSESQKRRYANGDMGYWKGKKLSEEHKRKVSENSARNFLGKHHTNETRLLLSKLKKKSIKQIDKNTGKVIKVWESTQDALKFFNKKSDSICHALRGRMKFAYGFKWEYA